MAGLRAELEALLEAVGRGEVEPAAALERFAALPYRDLGFARVDLHRDVRQGAPEVVLAEGKTKTPGQPFRSGSLNTVLLGSLRSAAGKS